MSGKERGKTLIIFDLDHDNDTTQLVTLMSEIVPLENMSLFNKSYQEDTWKSVVDRSSTIILHHTHSPGSPLPDLSDLEETLKHCREKCGPENIKVVITHMEDINSRTQLKERWMAGKYRDLGFRTFSKEDMDPQSTARRMVTKLRNIHRIIHEAAGNNTKQKLQVGMFPFLTEEQIKSWDTGPIYSRFKTSALKHLPMLMKWWNYSWITELLQSYHFNNRLLVQHVNISDDPTNLDKSCSFSILYCTQKRGRINVIDDTNAQLIREHRHRLGKDNVIVIIDDVEDSSDQEKIRIFGSQPKKEELNHNLFLFSDQEKSSQYKLLLSSLLTINKPRLQQADGAKPATEENTQRRHLPSASTGPSRSSSGFLSDTRNKFRTLGIFSRSSLEEYAWLAEMLRKKFKEVKSFYIRNSGFHEFMGEVSQCDVAILYHSKNRGRVNVTDVTDSLYDKELQHMSSRLGQQRVWVVIDDLDDNSEEVKDRILHSQPKIRDLAKDLYLMKKETSQKKVKDFELNNPKCFS